MQILRIILSQNHWAGEGSIMFDWNLIRLYNGLLISYSTLCLRALKPGADDWSSDNDDESASIEKVCAAYKLIMVLSAAFSTPS